MDWTESWKRRWKVVRRGTDKLLEVVPEDRMEWKPREGMLSVGDILRHMVWSEENFVQGAERGTYLMDQGGGYGWTARFPTVASVREAWPKIHEASLALYDRLGPAGLAEEVPSPYDPSRRYARLFVMNFHLEHEIHHRSQLATYLKLAGIEPPGVFF